MKIISICVLGVVLGLSVEGQAECPPFYGPTRPAGWSADYKTPSPDGTQIEYRCAIYTCTDGSWTSRGCGFYNCRDQIGFQDYDYTKAFPLCCPKPICRSDVTTK